LPCVRRRNPPTRSAAFVLATLLTLAGGGCSLVTSFDNFGGGTAGPSQDARASDAPGDADAATAEGSAPADDGGAPGDAPSTDDGPTGFCASRAAQVYFCADFDEGDPTSGWINGARQANAAQIYTGMQSTAALSSTQFLSPPNGLLATSGRNASWANLEVDFPGDTYTSAHIELALEQISAAAPPPAVEVVEIIFYGAGGAAVFDTELLLNWGGAAACFSVHGAPCAAPVTSAPGTLTPGQWLPITIDMDFSTQAVTAQVGGPGGASIHGTLPDMPSTSVGLSVVAGVVSGAGSVAIDNVTFTAN
jgi:hypothetical protein